MDTWQEVQALFGALLTNQMTFDQVQLVVFGLAFGGTVAAARLAKSQVLDRHRRRVRRLSPREKYRLDEEVRDHLEENYFHIPSALKR